MEYIVLAVSLAVLLFGAELLVRGSASLALRLGLSSLVVGLTVVAFGTSSPELVVSLKATLADKGDIAVGNVIGSNTFNIALILGLSALIKPIGIHIQLIKKELPILIGVSIVAILFIMNGVVSQLEGGILFLTCIGYTFFTIKSAKNSTESLLNDDKPSKSIFLDIAFIVLGLVLLIYGSDYLVESAVQIAKTWGISDAVIGLTIIAAGTSMPELATSVVAAFRNQGDIAIGNVIGSNIFNLLAILGFSSLVHPITLSNINNVDLAVMLGFTLLLAPFMITGKVIKAWEGSVFLLGYVVYLYYMISIV